MKVTEPIYLWYSEFITCGYMQWSLNTKWLLVSFCLPLTKQNSAFCFFLCVCVRQIQCSSTLVEDAVLNCLRNTFFTENILTSCRLPSSGTSAISMWGLHNTINYRAGHSDLNQAKTGLERPPQPRWWRS